MRTLASRTQTSTADTQQTIEKLQQGAHEAVEVMQQSREHTESSVTQITLASDALVAITATVVRINDMNTQIAPAAQEQGEVAEAINRNLINFAGVAEETIADASKTNDASKLVSDQAATLQALVTRFNA